MPTPNLGRDLQRRCPRVYRIERKPSRLSQTFLKDVPWRGLQPASTGEASWEVNEDDERRNPFLTMEESFEELLEKSFKTLNTGEVAGIVTAIGYSVQVDPGLQAGWRLLRSLVAPLSQSARGR